MGHEDLTIFKGKILWVWEDSHKFSSWHCNIDQFHRNEFNWHFNVDFICLYPIGATGVLLNAINDVKKLVF